jgi:ATP/maltotriose-dependent transcriptional regulator MalT
MSSLPVVLFTLGIIVLIIAWRLGNPPNTSPELLAALKGIAGVKRDIGYIRSELQETGIRLDEHERRIEERKALGLKSEEQPVLNREDREPVPIKLADQKLQLEFLKALQQKANQEPIANQEEDIDYTQNSVSQTVSEKYRGVIELHQQGWSILEIAGQLAISQDAVNMVLKTYTRGGGR